jgi:hypothetical protein
VRTRSPIASPSVTRTALPMTSPRRVGLAHRAAIAVTLEHEYVEAQRISRRQHHCTERDDGGRAGQRLPRHTHAHHRAGAQRPAWVREQRLHREHTPVGVRRRRDARSPRVEQLYRALCVRPRRAHKDLNGLPESELLDQHLRRPEHRLDAVSVGERQRGAGQRQPECRPPRAVRARHGPWARSMVSPSASPASTERAIASYSAARVDSA